MKEMDLFGADRVESDIERVKRDWRELEFVKDQTPEICLAAVQQNECALQYIKKQTPEICTVAVKKNGYALALVI